jgi:GT2 family glycosyltransferase
VSVPPRVTVVVLTWNRLAETRACLASLQALDYPALTLSVIDNASSDGAAAALRAEFPAAALRRNEKNLGYTGGNNAAIRAALADGADYVWLLNNDATVAPDTLARLIAVAEADAGIGLLSPLILRPGATGEGPPGNGGIGGDGTRPEFAGGLLDLAAGSYRSTEDPALGRHWQAAHPDRFVLTGTALLLRRALIERIGLLDERFFAYWEDTDYALRALQAGFLTRLAFDIGVRHAAKPAGHAAPHFHYLMARNEMLFWRKHLPPARAARPLYWALRRQLALAGASGQSRAARDAVMAGLWDGARGRGGAYDPGRRMPAPLARLVLALAPR